MIPGSCFGWVHSWFLYPPFCSLFETLHALFLSVGQYVSSPFELLPLKSKPTSAALSRLSWRDLDLEQWPVRGLNLQHRDSG
ncbi:hypothetical protein GN956_G16057 [Arapaima gigas]